MAKKLKENVLITGAAGFIGPQVVKMLLEETDYNVIALDKLTYAARVENSEPLSLKLVLDSLNPSARQRYSFIKLDICSDQIPEIIKKNKIDYLMNLAAESHVDRSLDGTPEFLVTEILGTHNLLETIRKHNLEDAHKVKRALFVSTDEVFGSIDRISGFEGEEWYSLSDREVEDLIEKYKFTEKTPFAGGSPYASCKGGADLMVGSYYNSFKWDKKTGKIAKEGMPVIISHCVNNFGPYHHPEKLIPLAICTLLMPEVGDVRRKIPVYDFGLAVREWIHSREHAKALIQLMQNGEIGESYNIGSGIRYRNKEILQMIFETLRDEAKQNGFSNLESALFDASSSNGLVRPGHDLCYAADSKKIRQDKKIDWDPSVDSNNFKKEIVEVIEWYKQNRSWWEPIWTSEEFVNYWNRKYRTIMEASN